MPGICWERELVLLTYRTWSGLKGSGEKCLMAVRWERVMWGLVRRPCIQIRRGSKSNEAVKSSR